MQFINILKVLILCIIEGVTEWLPVSSTGHMKLFNAFWQMEGVSSAFMETFEYVIQLAAILAVVLLFWKTIFPLGKVQPTPPVPLSGTESNTEPTANLTTVTTIADEKSPSQRGKIVWKKDVLSLWVKVLIACVPALFALLPDMLFEKLCEKHELIEPLSIACTLILYGVVFIVVENRNANRNPKICDLSQLSYRSAFYVGCFQILAVIPGTSRSGITIIGALLLGIDRTTASKFTFILAIPTMVGASAYKLLKFFLSGAVMTYTEIVYLLLGCVVAFVVSLLTVKALMDFVKKHNFKPFGWYRIALGVVVICALILPQIIG